MALADPPKHLVFHLDILNVLVRLINHPVFMEDMQIDLKVLQPREPEDLIDKETSKRMFRHYLNRSFQGFEMVLINTLYAPYGKNVEQWQTKALEHSSVDLEYPLFDVNNPRPDIHESVYEAWTETVEKLDYHRVYASAINDDVLELKQRKPDVCATRKFRMDE